MPQTCKKPLYARVLGWAADWEPKRGSLAEAVLEDLLYVLKTTVWATEAVLRKFQANKNKKENNKEVDE